MRILQVVTLVSPDSAYGGPLRVAVNQVRELRARGHEVELVASYRGYENPPHEVDDVTITAFPARQVLPGLGFAGVASPSMMKWLRRHRRDFDVVHIHYARDLVAVPAATVFRGVDVKVVLQCHGMVDPTTRVLGKLLDAGFTRRHLRRAAAVCYLTDREAQELVEVAGSGVQLQRLTNGVPRVASQKQWSDVASTEFIFISRLHQRKRPTALLEGVVALRKQGHSVVGVVAGPDEGEGPRVQRLVDEYPMWLSREPALASDEVSQRLLNADVFVLPSRDEPFPMAVLEAMSVGLPVIVAESCGLSTAVRSADAGIVVRDDLSDLPEAMETLADSLRARVQRGANATALVAREFSMGHIVDRLESVYGKWG